jgi:hypothetical protein
MSELTRHFEKMGARVTERVDPTIRLELDVMHDRHGEYFMVRHGEDVEVDVLDVSNDRHLLLSVNGAMDGPGNRAEFLCGRDERHWFVAAIPESANARTVQEAMDALKPPEVWESIREHRLPPEDRNRRRTAAFLRQGEWFFLPRPWLKVDPKLVLENEPIRRGAGKAHICRYLHRVAGQLVYVCDAYPNGLSRGQYRKLSAEVKQQHRWIRMRRNARVFVKGTITHPDHSVLGLAYWHQVVMNTETQSRYMSAMAFLD